VYIGHHRFLSVGHPVRKKGKHFKGKVDHRTKPRNRTRDDILKMVKDMKVVFCKAKAVNLFPKTFRDMHPRGRRSPYFESYPTGMS